MVQGACGGAHADVHDHGRKEAAAGPGGQERYLTAIEFSKAALFFLAQERVDCIVTTFVKTHSTLSNRDDTSR